MAPKIPDDVLETDVCKICDKYLTVCPISAHPDGGNVCGRCVDKNDPTLPLFECDSLDEHNFPYAIFGYTNNHLFPCVNRFEGCTELLPFHQISNHELTCKPSAVKCGVCLNYEGSGSQLIAHFNKNHPQNFVNNPKFSIDLAQEFSTYLVKVDDCLFFVDALFDVNNDQVRVWVKSLTLLKDEIGFCCLIKNGDGESVGQTIIFRDKQDELHRSIDIDGKELWKRGIYCECRLQRLPKSICS